MALINCPECGREVSDQAEACPRCAFPIAKKSMSPAAPAGGTSEPADSEEQRVETDGEPQGEPQGEHTIWAGTPSQLTNFKPVVGSLLLSAAIVAAPILFNTYVPKYANNKLYYGLFLLLIPAVVMFWNWLQISCNRYEITSERIKVRTGILARAHEIVELYRVKDISLERPFVMRLFGLGNVVAITSDKTMPTVRFWAIPNATEVYEDLRKHVERRRVQRRVREVDIE